MVAMTQEENDYLTVEEAAKRYNVTERTVRNWYGSRKIRYYKRSIDGTVYVRAAEIDEKMRILPVNEGEENADAGQP